MMEQPELELDSHSSGKLGELADTGHTVVE